MRTELFTVSRIFTEALYRIPDYQRGYSWKNDQLKDFWLDIEQIRGDGKHYTGVLTLETVPEEKWSKWDDDRWIIKSRRYCPYYVVDGQQRLTTVIILLQAILEAASTAQLNYTPLTDIRRKYIFDSKQEEASRSYIFGYEKDNPSYEFLKKKIFIEESDVHLPDEETIYTKNLISAKHFFAEKLKSVSNQALETIYTKVTQQLVFNVYEISSDIDVFVTFETMNNRGKPLSTLELLKNRLIFLSTKIPVTDGNGEKLRRTINEAWKSTYHYLGKNDERPLGDDEFLRTHLSYYYIKNLSKVADDPEDDDGRSLRKFIISIEDFNRFLLNELFTPKRLNLHTEKRDEFPALTREFIYEYSQNLKTSIETYFKLSTPSQSSFSDTEKIALERIGRLKGFTPSNLLLAVYRQETSSTKRIQFLEQLERYFFCHSLGFRGPYQYSRRTQAPSFFPSYINGKMPLDEIITLLENQTNELFKEKPLPELLHDWVKDGAGYYGWRSIKFFLYEYELHLQSKTKSHREKLNWSEFCREDFEEDFETIEHIYPQKARDRYWTERFSKFPSAQKRLLRNSIGNLLPLSRPRNSSLGNKSFPEKLGDEASKTGYRYGCYSENDVALQTEWSADQILNRGVALLNFLEQRWKLSIGDRNNKIRALGLSFLTQAGTQGSKSN